MKKLFLLLLILLTFSVFSCSNDNESEETTFTITVKNEYTSAYFVAVKKDGNSKSDFIGAINPSKTEKFTFEKGTVINKVEFYSGINMQTMSQVLQTTYDSEITSNITLVIKNNQVSKE